MVAQRSALARVIDFLTQQPTDAEIMALRPSLEETQRIEQLIQLRDDENITREDAEELQSYIYAEYAVSVAKVKAFTRLRDAN